MRRLENGEHALILALPQADRVIQEAPLHDARRAVARHHHGLIDAGHQEPLAQHSNRAGRLATLDDRGLFEMRRQQRVDDGHAWESTAALALRMRTRKELLRRLTKVVDLRNGGRALDRVRDLGNVDGALVREIVKDVESLLGVAALLAEAEHEVDPLVEMFANVLGLEGLAHDTNKLVRVALGPRRQHDVVDALASLLRAKVEAIGVLQHLGQVVELGNQLLDVGEVAREAGGRLPRLVDAVEQAIGHVEATTLQLEEVLRKRFEANQIIEHDAGARVVCAVMELGHVAVLRGLPNLVALCKFGRTRWCQSAHRLREISVDGRVVEVERLTLVVGEHPREHGILRQIVVRSAGQRVEVHQILKVANLSLQPSLRRVRQQRVLGAPEGQSHPNVELRRGGIATVDTALRAADISGRRARARDRRRQVLIDLVALRRIKYHQVVASVIGKDLDRDRLQEIAAFERIANVILGPLAASMVRVARRRRCRGVGDWQAGAGRRQRGYRPCRVRLLTLDLDNLAAARSLIVVDNVNVVGADQEEALALVHAFDTRAVVNVLNVVVRLEQSVDLVAFVVFATIVVALEQFASIVLGLERIGNLLVFTTVVIRRDACDAHSNGISLFRRY